MPKNAKQIQAFLKEVRAQNTDVLVLDLTTVWEKRYGNRPLLYGLRTHWRREQVTQAVPRVLKAVVALPTIALETEADRARLLDRLLISADVVPDIPLITWLQSTSAAERRSLREQVELLLPHINSAGYRAIAAEAARIGWPKFYKEDLGIDLHILCSADAPKEFWWGVRSTGTDLFQPNSLASVEWALAHEKHGSGEQIYYAYTEKTLRPLVLHTMILQLVRSLNCKEYEQRWHDAITAKSALGEAHLRTLQDLAAYPQVIQTEAHAETAYRRVVQLKQLYR